MKVAYYSPMPPSRSGIADYSALLLPELEKRIDVVVARPGRFRRDPPADIAPLPRRQRRRGARLDRRGAPPAARRRRPARLRPPPPRRRPDVRARRRRRLPRGDGARGRASSAGCSPTPCSTTSCRRCGRRGPRTSRSPARCSTTRPALIVHSHYVERRARETGYRGPIVADPAPGLADPGARSRPTSTATRCTAASAT